MIEVADNIVTGYTCEECGERFNAPAVLVGEVFCPQCGKVITFHALEE